MILDDRLTDLSAFMCFESGEDRLSPRISDRRLEDVYVTHAALPNGKRISLLKTLLTSACERNCNYCPFRAGRDFRRATLSPDEMAKVFIALNHAGIVQGLFLSSGIIKGGVTTQDKLIDTVEILRTRYHYTGYVHLKILPGADYSQIERSMQIADRVSINLEAPNSIRLNELAPKKDFKMELLRAFKWIDEIKNHRSEYKFWKSRYPSITTQYVVGPAGESDHELLSTTKYLHNKFGLSRAYFMAFTPVTDTPFADKPRTSPIRERRLYQASYLLRDYGYTLEEIPFSKSGYLSSDTDPKAEWAKIHLSYSPVEINTAPPHILIRVPGIGPKTIKAILVARKLSRITSVMDLKKIGINITRCLPYILLDGKRPGTQLSYL